MKKILIPILLVALIGAGSAYWYFVVRDDSLNVSTQSIDSSKSTDSIEESDSSEGSWILQKQADVFIGYEIQELFGGDSVKKTAAAKTEDVSGTLAIKDSKLTEVKIVADLTQLKSDSARRDSTQEKEGLETNKFPDATFELIEAQDLGEIVKSKEISIVISGELTLHGATKPVSIPATAIWDGKVIKISGALEINLSDYEIEPPKNSFVSVDDSGIIKLQLLFIPGN